MIVYTIIVSGSLHLNRELEKITREKTEEVQSPDNDWLRISLVYCVTLDIIQLIYCHNIPTKKSIPFSHVKILITAFFFCKENNRIMAQKHHILTPFFSLPTAVACVMRTAELC